jgi:hypothetical protein
MGSASETGFWGRRLRAGIDAATVALAVGFIASYFPLSLLLAATTPSGGDMASHFYPAVYLSEILLPRGQLIGWCPGNYAGFPLFQFYFPLPFLGMAALGLAMPMEVAFKLVSMAGLLLLPPCTYVSLRLLRVPFPGPALGAVATLPFLFMEANTMWGGNIPSTLAGEFTFSFGLALAVLFVGTLRRTMETGRGWVGNGVLVAVIGLCHGYPLLWAGLVSLLELVTTRGWWRRFLTLVGVHGLALLLMGFWLLQLLWYAPWSTAFNVTWVFQSWQEVLPPILWPAAGLALASAAIEAFISWRRREPWPHFLFTLWGAIGISLFFYATAHSFHVVDIRFLPFFQLGLCLAAAAGLGRLLARGPAPELWLAALSLAALPFVQSQVHFIPEWVRWNYSGFETKQSWPILRDLSRHLAGDFRDPRVVYEHAPETETLGTVRAFESLPLFSGRSTLEGLYMQSSITTPFVFFAQSEYSKHISCPLPEWGCTRVELDQALAHLRMFNVSQLVARSDEVKRLAAAHPELHKEITVGDYEIYGVQGGDGRYVVPLRYSPSLVSDEAWKEVAYRWFKQARPGDPVPVFAGGVAFAEEASDSNGFAGVFEEMPPELPRRRLGDPVPLEEHLEPGRITVTGAEPGHPLLIRVSYHPRWRAKGGERIWLAAPSFMLVFPNSERVELEFVAGPVLTVGRVASGLGLLVVLLALLPPGRRLGRRLQDSFEGLGNLPGIRPFVRQVERSGSWPDRIRLFALAALLAGVGLGVGVIVFFGNRPDAHTVYRKGLDLFAEERRYESADYFREAYTLEPLSMTAMHARYFEALVYFQEEDWAEAEQRFQELVTVFPEAINAPEALYHVGVCRARQEDQTGAVAAWRETAQRFPDTVWARYAKERLAETRRHQP